MGRVTARESRPGGLLAVSSVRPALGGRGLPHWEAQATEGVLLVVNAAGGGSGRRPAPRRA